MSIFSRITRIFSLSTVETFVVLLLLSGVECDEYGAQLNVTWEGTTASLPRIQLEKRFKWGQKTDDLDVVITRDLDIKGAVRGSEVLVTAERRVMSCTDREACPQCGGSGSTTRTQHDRTIHSPCPFCKGMGYTYQDGCSTSTEPLTVAVRIPPGSRPGYKAILKGKGHMDIGAGGNIIQGDFVYRVGKVSTDPFTVVDGDIQGTFELSPEEALHGYVREFPVPLSGTMVRVTRASITLPGTELLLPNEGLPSLNEDCFRLYRRYSPSARVGADEDEGVVLDEDIGDDDDDDDGDDDEKDSSEAADIIGPGAHPDSMHANNGGGSNGGKSTAKKKKGVVVVVTPDGQQPKKNKHKQDGKDKQQNGGPEAAASKPYSGIRKLSAPPEASLSLCKQSPRGPLKIVFAVQPTSVDDELSDEEVDKIYYKYEVSSNEKNNEEEEEEAGTAYTGEHEDGDGRDGDGDGDASAEPKGVGVSHTTMNNTFGDFPDSSTTAMSSGAENGNRGELVPEVFISEKDLDLFLEKYVTDDTDVKLGVNPDGTIFLDVGAEVLKAATMFSESQRRREAVQRRRRFSRAILAFLIDQKKEYDRDRKERAEDAQFAGEKEWSE